MTSANDSSSFGPQPSDAAIAPIAAVAAVSRPGAVSAAPALQSPVAENRTRQNVAIMQASLEVSMQAKNQPLSLLLKSAIAGINDLLAPQFGEDAIQAAAGEDNTPAGTAGRIVALSTGFYAAYQQLHPNEDGNEVLRQFMSTIRSGFESGGKEAKAILQGMGVLDGDIASNIEKTLSLVRQGYAEFEAAQRKPSAAAS